MTRRGSRIGGGYLLSHFRSTIGAAGFNFSVRNGKRWNPRAMAALVRLSVNRMFCLRFQGLRLFCRFPPAAVLGKKEGGGSSEQFRFVLSDSLPRVRRNCLAAFPPKACRLWSCVFVLCFVCFPSLRPCGRSDGCLFAERGWVISIARLRTLPPVYLRPIDVIVFDGPYVEILS